MSFVFARRFFSPSETIALAGGGDGINVLNLKPCNRILQVKPTVDCQFGFRIQHALPDTDIFDLKRPLRNAASISTLF